jgi:hypothetical protein
MSTADALALATALAKVVGKIPDAVEQVSSWISGGPRPGDVLAELPSLEANRLEMARIEALAEQGR